MTTDTSGLCVWDACVGEALAYTFLAGAFTYAASQTLSKPSLSPPSYDAPGDGSWSNNILINRPSNQFGDGLITTVEPTEVTALLLITTIHAMSWFDLIFSSEKLNYVPTEKHKKGGWGTEMDLDDKTAQNVLNDSIKGGKQRYGYLEGKLYEFQPDNQQGWHGYPIKGTEAPPSVLKKMRENGIITNPEYKKFIKGK